LKEPRKVGRLGPYHSMPAEACLGAFCSWDQPWRGGWNGDGDR
jgi:hypothetical protein